jgi:hypothetical protein
MIVAHHSGADHEAALRGFAHLNRWHDADADLVAMLTYIDRTTGPGGSPLTVEQRRADLVRRYGEDSTPVQVLDLTLPMVERGRSLCDGEL